MFLSSIARPAVRAAICLAACCILFPARAQERSSPGAGGLAGASETERVYLSGHGPEDPINWEFFCTAGRNSRVWTTIAVPSCWEQQGFGGYNYGNEINADAIVAAGEQGLYRRRFTVPPSWRGRRVRIVFDGSMTDTTVWVNGQQAGETHQGAFYRFHYDITPLLKFGETNLLEVTVAKMSSNRSVNNAERAADYWVFGGIFRPVWLEARPVASIERTAIDARADGRLAIDVFLDGAENRSRVDAQVIDAGQQPVGEVLRSTVVTPINPAEAGFHEEATKLQIRGQVAKPRTWTAETPNLYRVRLTLVGPDGQPRHTITERFGFRTIEVRENDGVYLNGTRIVLKGVDRHAFWPETGRTVSREQSYADARLMKEANLNAVRMSHYPPDEHFLEACDELGLYVLDELGGWQKSYATPIGARLAGELIRRDVNHPSILFWDNGNEGGWNEKNDGEFAKWDPQARAVLHPRGVSGAINTLHYARYDQTVKLSAGPQIFMPTEFLHGLYDGGIGAGLRDYWEVMGKSKTVAGGFLWVWSDEGVVRRDQDNRIDTVGNQAPDGMTGPHREKEGSYFTVKAIWSPIQLALPVDAAGALPAAWDGTVGIENGYDFTSLERCRLEWELLRYGMPGRTEALPHHSKEPLPHTSGDAWRKVVLKGSVPAPALAPRTSGKLTIRLPKGWQRNADAIHVTARGPAGEALWTWSASVRHASLPAGARTRTSATTEARAQRPATTGSAVRDDKEALTVTAPAGELRFDKRTGMLASWQRRGHQAPITNGPAARAYLRHDHVHDAIPDRPELLSLTSRQQVGAIVVEARYNGILRKATWRIDERASDAVRLDCEYAYEGSADILGVGFDLPATGVESKRWLGRGPYRVYRNRLEGNVFDLHTGSWNDPVPGQSFTYPEFKGYFRDWRWLQVDAAGGQLTVENGSNVPFFGLYGPRDGEPAMLAFPDSGLAFLDIIPAQGTKFDTPDQLGPQSRTPAVSGDRHAGLVLRFNVK